jgi:Tfp pilus assembly protein PilN
VRPVNLLPARYQPARASGDRPGIGYAAIGALVVILLMVLAYVVTNNGIKDANQKTADARAEQQAAEAKIGQLQAYGDFAALRTSRETAVRGVASLRFDYERLMREMALVLPHNTYLTSFSAAPGSATATSGGATGTGPTVTIAGCAPSHEGVATAVVRLRKLHDITDVTLSNSTKGASSSSTSGSSACPTQFGATLTFNAETPTTVPAPVPARLGGGQ